MITQHMLRVYDAVIDQSDWITAREVARIAAVANRTARQHCLKLTEAGVFECARVHGGFRYRRNTNPNIGVMASLERARPSLRLV